MAEEDAKPAFETTAIPVVKIAPEIPAIFADGVISQAFAPGITKFFFYRTDTGPIIAEGDKTIPVAQIIMPAEGFAAMVHFLQHRLKLMIEHGAISQEAVDKINQTDYPENATVGDQK
jgi:hypothetical protein